MSVETLEELTENFSLFDDWEERYRYLIDMGQNLPPISDDLKTDDKIVRGCTSRVWLVTKIETSDDGTRRLTFVADSDAMIVRGLIAILMVAYNNKSKSDIEAVKIDDWFESLGLSAHLSPSRRNGFFSMVERIKAESLLL
ncbi:MAG TPA: SufE family protein [Micavibrio sp.]|nr:SufE family protein [Micavibrio sp.]HIL28884.1 SufE family protein [Micavibrio sp.]